MKLMKAVRSWSFPPAYSVVPQDDVHPTSTQAPVHNNVYSRIVKARRPDISAYLLTFSKQWLLVHVITIFCSVALMCFGTAVFVTRPLSFNNAGEVKHAWLCGATGMICAVINGAVFGALQKLDTPDLGLTLEQQGTRRFITVAVAVLGQLAVGAIMLAIGAAAPKKGDWMGVLRRVAYLAATLNVVACIYDIIRQNQSKQDSEDDWGPDEFEDELPRQIGRPSGAIHL